jgi:hypothetical protein
VRGYGGIYTSSHRKLAVDEGYLDTPSICVDTPDSGVRRLRTRSNLRMGDNYLETPSICPDTSDILV